ncbi:amine oxidase [copper-containing] [Mizuhopecten yessoensis]|uniref:Amine oxidase n=1 Tax=Mizuhopecten yessoensis TaxID=6573 RepID=A0A210QB68_MIZYE|nr:amine oxidase [copper-containing] [Mizuhopecten yessoensis]
MPNVVLTLRSTFTVNGVVQVRAMSTGYILATFHTDQEAPYGAQVHDYISGNMHIHLFNFKVDIDIKGKTNRFATWDIAPTSRPNDYSATPNAKYHMTNYSRNVKATELVGAYKFNFDAPKYPLFYNEQEKNAYGNPKAYRIVNRGMVKQLFTEGEGNEPAASWARYQVAVTKYKESERRSSSAYAYMDSSDPVVRFQNFIDDDESIVDEDLVAWVTMGLHHIPHTEDLPVTPSPGMDLSFYLLPYNYFTEDPAMASKSSVRVELNNGVKVTHYGAMKGKRCLTKKNDYFEMLLNNPNVVVDSGDGSTEK